MFYHNIPAWLAALSIAVTAALVVYEYRSRRAQAHKRKENRDGS